MLYTLGRYSTSRLMLRFGMVQDLSHRQKLKLRETDSFTIMTTYYAMLEQGMLRTLEARCIVLREACHKKTDFRNYARGFVTLCTDNWNCEIRFLYRRSNQD